MSQTAQQTQDISNLIHRLKARLALANFKRERGFENVDLRTLESSLYDHKLRENKTSSIDVATTTAISPSQDRKRRKLLSHHRFYPTSPPLQHNDIDRLIKKNTPRSPGNIPLSETRMQHTTYGSGNQRKLSATLSSDDEDAAHLLVLMHHSPTMSS